MDDGEAKYTIVDWPAFKTKAHMGRRGAGRLHWVAFPQRDTGLAWPFTGTEHLVHFSREAGGRDPGKADWEIRPPVKVFNF